MNKHILNLLLAASMTLGAIGFAQTATAIKHASSIVAPTYLDLNYVRGALQISTSSIEADHLSPKVQIITYKEGHRPVGFKVLHTNTTLGEVANYYWDALSELGFISSMNAGSRRVTSYRFENGNSRLVAVFTQNGGNVVADLSWIGTELAATVR